MWGKDSFPYFLHAGADGAGGPAGAYRLSAASSARERMPSFA